MLIRRDAAAEVSDRPYNNLLRRLNWSDFALLDPYLSQHDAAAMVAAVECDVDCHTRFRPVGNRRGFENICGIGVGATVAQRHGDKTKT